MWENIKTIKEFFSGGDDGEIKIKKKVEKKSKDIGEEVTKSVTEGVKKGKSTVVKQVEEVAVSLTSKLKETLGLKGSNNAIRDEVGAIIPIGIAQGITKEKKSVITAFNDVLETINYQRQMDIINDEQYYAALESLRDKYFSKGSDKWLYYTAQIYTYQKELLEQEKKYYEETYSEIFEYASDKIDAVIKKQQDYEEKLQSYGKVFQKNTILLDEGNIEFYSLADLKADNEQLERYTALMLDAKKFVQESGLSEDAVSALLAEIGSLPVNSATTALEALMKNPSSKSWLEEYEKRIQLTKTQSAMYYQDEMDTAFDESTDYMKERLTQAGFEIPASFFDAGKDSAGKFGDGFSEELSVELEKIKAQIAEFSSLIEVSVTQQNSTDKTKSGDEINTTNYYITAGIKENVADTIKRYETIKRLGGY